MMMHDSCIHKLPPLLLLLPPHRQEGYRVILLNSNPVSHAVLLGVLVCHAVLVEGVGPMHAADDGGGGLAQTTPQLMQQTDHAIMQ